MHRRLRTAALPPAGGDVPALHGLFPSPHCAAVQKFGDVSSKLIDVENELIVALEKAVAQNTFALHAIDKRVAEIDALCALAATVVQREWV